MTDAWPSVYQGVGEVEMRGRILVVVLLLLTSIPGRSAAGVHVQARDARNAARRGDTAGIVEAARAAQRAMPFFAADGETTVQMTIYGRDQSIASRFALRFARPNRYRITWSQSEGPAGAQRGAVWNAGDGAYVYFSPPGVYAPASSDEIALAAATGVSQGLASDAWALFFEGNGLLADLRAPTLDGTEEVEGEACWKLSGSSRVFERMSIWIATKRLVVRKVEHSLGLSSEGRTAAEALMDDAQVDEALRAGGVEPTPERRAQMKAVMEMAKVAAKATGSIDGHVTQLLHHVQVGERFADADFAFEVPPGTPLRSSLLAATLGEEPAKPAAPEARPGDPARGGELLDRVVARYKSLRSYVSDGEIVRLGSLGTDAVATAAFSLTFARPDRYRILWWKGRRTSADAAEGAVWDAGDGAFEYGRPHGAYTRLRDDSTAFAVAAGVSDGLTRGLPPLFFHGEGWLTELRDPAFDGTEVVDGEPCDVISGSSRSSAKHTLWIGRDLLIRRHRHVHAQRPEDERDRRASEDYAFEEMRRRATPEAKPMVDMMVEMQRAAEKLPTADRGETTEIYRNIRVDGAVERSDVAFEVPAGTPLRASLTEGMFRTEPAVPAVGP